MSVQYDFKSDKLIDTNYNAEVFDEEEKDKRATELGMGIDKNDPENRYNGTREMWNKLDK